MDKLQCFSILRSKLPLADNDKFLEELEMNCVMVVLERNETLIKYQDNNKKMFFIVSGSFVRNIITSRGEEKTVMFHTESFHEFVKAYDTIYFHERTNYEIKANEKSIVLAFDYDFMYQRAKQNLTLLQYYTQRTEQLLTTIDVFHNFQLGLTSEEYLLWLYKNHNFLFQRFPAQNIASFMGITPVWLSKLKAKISS
jgi:hypothetical protein